MIALLIIVIKKYMPIWLDIYDILMYTIVIIQLLYSKLCNKSRKKEVEMKTETNKEVRQTLKSTRVKYAELAQHLGVQRTQLSFLLRYELAAETKAEFINVINAIKATF